MIGVLEEQSLNHCVKGEGQPMRDDPAVIALVARARDGDQHAWNEIVDRYAPLVWSICNRYQLNRNDIDDVGQTVWLLLVEQLGKLRVPAALPGWLATTTQRECLRLLRAARRYDSSRSPADNLMSSDESSLMIEQEVIAAELNAALRAAFAELPHRCRQLLSMLLTDPPLSYAEISATLQIPIGSIGPQRARCLERLRRSPALAAFTDREINGSGTEDARTYDAGGGPRA
jgi:RNA polymerase sigma factor (sigma-70 family)